MWNESDMMKNNLERKFGLVKESISSKEELYSLEGYNLGIKKGKEAIKELKKQTVKSKLENKFLRRILDSKKKALSSVEQDFTMVESEVSDLIHKHSDLQNHISRIDEKIEECHEGIEAANSKKEELELKIKNKKQEILTREDSFRENTKEVKNLKHQISILQKELDFHNMELESHKDSRDWQKDLHGTLVKEFSNLNEERNTLEKQNLELKNDLENLKNECLEIDSQIERKKNEVRKYKGESLDLEERLEQENIFLSEKKEGLEKLNTESEEVNNKYKSLKLELFEISKNCKNQDQEKIELLKTLSSTKKKTSEIKVQIELEEVRLENWAKEREEWKAKVQKEGILLKKLNTQKEYLLKENEQLKQDILSQTLSWEKANKSVILLTEQIEEKSRMQNTLKQDYSVISRRLHKDKTLQVELNQKLKQVTSNLEKENKAHLEKHNVYSQTLTKIKEIENQISRKMKLRFNALNDINAMKAESLRTNSKIDSLLLDEKKLDQEILTLSQSLNGISDNYQKRASELKEIQIRFQSKVKKFGEDQNRYSLFKQKIQKIKGEKKETESKILSVSEKILRLKGESAHLESELNHKQVGVNKLIQQKVRMDQSYKKLQNVIENQKIELDKLNRISGQYESLFHKAEKIKNSPKNSSESYSTVESLKRRYGAKIKFNPSVLQDKRRRLQANYNSICEFMDNLSMLPVTDYCLSLGSGEQVNFHFRLEINLVNKSLQDKVEILEFVRSQNSIKVGHLSDGQEKMIFTGELSFSRTFERTVS